MSGAGNSSGVSDNIIYQEAMVTYRYLVDMTVKYMLMFFGVAAFSLRPVASASQNATELNPTIHPNAMIYFATYFGIYISFTLALVIWRMRNITSAIAKVSATSSVKHQFHQVNLFLWTSFVTVTLATIILVIYCINLGT